MKRTAVLLAILSGTIMSVPVWAGAQASTQPATQTPSAAGQTAPATAAPAAGATDAAAVKRPPQAKTAPEFDAYKLATANTDPAALEKATEDFANKFPDSELRILLYKQAMRQFQTANNAEKTEAMGRKVIGLDGDEPEALVTVAEVIAERTRESDIDKDQRFSEAVAFAKKATQTVDTDVQVPAGTPQEKLDAYKALLRSNAYSILGTIDFKLDKYAEAQENLQKSIDAYPSNPDSVVVLRLALALDKQGKYPEALKVANKAVDMTKENTAVGTPARHERDRLAQLTGGTAPAQPATPPKN